MGHAPCDGAHTGRGLAQAGFGQADLGHVGLGQLAHKADVQSELAAVGLGRVVGHLHIACAYVGQAGQLSLHLGGQAGAVGGVTDVSCGLTGKTELEAARRLGLRGAQLSHQRGQVDAEQGAAKGDLVAARHCAGHVDAAVTAQSRVERVAHGGGIGAELQGGGGVGLAAMGQAEGEAASATGLDVHLLDLGQNRALTALRELEAGARRGFAAQMKLKAGRGQGLACQLAHQAHLIQVALAGVAAVQSHRDVGYIGHAASQALVERGKGRAHLGDGGGHRAVAPVDRTHLLGRAVHQAQLVLLNDFFSFEEDVVGRRAARPTGLHLADHGSGRRRRCAGVAHQREALLLAEPSHGGVLELDHALGHEEDVVSAGHRGGGENDVIDLGQPGLAGLRGADVHADWRGFFAQGAQRELFDLGAAGLGRF